MRERKVILVQTLTIVEKVHTKRFPEITASVKRAHDLGVRVVCGGDTGTFAHGENVRELEILVQAGSSGGRCLGGLHCGRLGSLWRLLVRETFRVV